MRSLAIVIEQMLAVIPEGGRGYLPTIKFVLEEVRARLPHYPPEAESSLWQIVAYRAMEPLLMRLVIKDRPLDEDEQRLCDIFRGPLKAAHVVELPRDPIAQWWPEHSGPPPLDQPNYVECYCTLPVHQPGDPIVLAGSL